MTHDPSFASFKHRMFARLDNALHLQYLDGMLESVERYTMGAASPGDPIGRLIVSMPPRHGKTFTVSRLFPAWMLGRHPTTRIILASYTASLAEKNSRMVRNLMRSPLYQSGSGGVRPARPHEGSATIQSWDIVDHDGQIGGGMDAVGVGGGITGKGGDLIIVDDPIKSRAEAENPARREKIWEWFTDDLYTRREPHAAVIVVMTRWHLDDLVGRLLLNMPEAWAYLRLPALAQADDPLKRTLGAPLWADRFPLAMLEETRRTLGEYAWAGLYQQEPIPSGGGLFKPSDFHIIADIPADVKRRVRYWDLAMTVGEHSDYSVGVLLGETERSDLIVLDVKRIQENWHTTMRTVIAQAQDDGAGVLIGIETAAGGKQVIDQLLRELHGFWAKGYPPRGRKEVRALPFSAKVSAGQVYVLNRVWTQPYLEELASFPRALHDDQVDATAGALAMFDGDRALRVETLLTL